jgi:hypothetical protein
MSNAYNFASRTRTLIALGAFGCLFAGAAACGSSEKSKKTGGTCNSPFICAGAAGAAATGGRVGGFGGSGPIGGESGAGGTGGEGGSDPDVPIEGVDLLFMIDNSRSMVDKQDVLREAVPALVERLVNPMCIDPNTGALSRAVTGQCPAPLVQEFKPVDDIHIGIVTSSLGGHGSDTCSPALSGFDPSEDDKAQLLPSVRAAIPQYGNTGFLAWDPTAKHQPQGESNSASLVANFQAQVAAVGEIGCGFEASLEAWYRFLIDPDPPQDVVKQGNEAVVQRPNQTILEQRRQFLRPNSLVAVIMLTDENDCSTFDGGIAWLAGQAGTGDGGLFTLPRATSACQINPNDPCCRSCNSIEAAPPPGCQSTDADPGCIPRFHTDQSDPVSLRCWDQKRRFGVDFLYGVGRYIEGLTSRTVHDFQGRVVPNPLYMDLTGGNRPARPRKFVYLAGILGVPWQDIATEQTLGNPNDLEYLTAIELNTRGRWDMILGDPGRGIPPTDALMFESPYDRTTLQGLHQSHPLGLGNLAPAFGQLRSNPINGNEYVPPNSSDLQYACIFPLATPHQCGSVAGCDCSSISQGQSKPLCEGTEQRFAKAYPGLRHLQVLKGIGEQVVGVNNAIVASICPKITDRNNPAYGYNPAMASIIGRLREQLDVRQ